MEANKKEDKGKKLAAIPAEHSEIWFIAAFLAMLLLLTMALLSAILKIRSGDESNVIMLYIPDSAVNTGADVIETETIYTGSTGSAVEDPGFETEDAVRKWETYTSVDLFQEAYANEDGVVTVVSDNGDKIIAPGTTNDYEFSVKNTGNISLDYTLDLNEQFTLASETLPIQVRLRRGEDFIVGGSDLWVSPNLLDEVKESGTLGVNKYIVYTLEWRWPFDYDDADAQILYDLNDTMLADMAVTQEVDFSLDITVEAKVTPGAVAESGNSIETARETIVRRIASLPLGVPVGFICGTAAGFALLILFWLRKRVNFTGILRDEHGSAIEGVTMRLKSKWRKNRMCVVGREGSFAILSVPAGKKILVIEDENGNVLTENELCLKWKRKADPIEFEDESQSEGIDVGVPEGSCDDPVRITIRMARKLVTIEIHLNVHAGGDFLTVAPDVWSVVDRDRNVITS